MTGPGMEDDGGFAARIQGRLDRLGLTAAEAGAEARLPSGLLPSVLDGTGAPPRGRRLVALADALACSVAYLVGLDPDGPVPEEWLAEDQGTLGLLAGDEEALLRAYRRLDVSGRAALLLVVTRMAPPEPDAKEGRRKRGS